MAKEKKSYPMMSASNWWTLRKKFRTTVPKEVTTTYLASVLKMSELSAKNNVLQSLRITGLINEAGIPQDRALKWRDDEQYSQVCKGIREEVYPQELLDLAPDASTERSTIQTWFANNTGVGTSAAYKLASFYLLLVEADPSKESGITATGSTSARTKSTGTQRKSEPNSKKQPPTPKREPAIDEHCNDAKKSPEIHVNVQIHISHEALPDQIDQIFASMAKHLKEFS